MYKVLLLLVWWCVLFCVCTMEEERDENFMHQVLCREEDFFFRLGGI